MLEDISYRNYKKKSDIHGTVLYPATMIAPVQNDILCYLIENDKINNIFDPFHGTGTALYEGMEISNKIELYGCDINPLANLITKVKLSGVSYEINQNIEKLKKMIANRELHQLHNFNNIEKWFRKDIIFDLTRIRNAIMQIENKQDRLYFWYMFCDVIRKYSNTQSSTYKLFIKPKEKIENMQNNVISDYLTKISQNIFKFNKKTNKFQLFKMDILKKINDFDNYSFDISITSPPYGDNATTVTYGQFSMLSLYWIDKDDLELEGWELDNYSAIDTRSLGGCWKNKIESTFEKSLIIPFLELVNEDKKNKVEAFFADYFTFLKQICRVTNKYIVMTLGNRTVSGVNINLTQITMLYLENNKFTNVKIAQREILNKRTPHKTSRVNNMPIDSICKEYVIIYKRVEC